MNNYKDKYNKCMYYDLKKLNLTTNYSKIGNKFRDSLNILKISVTDFYLLSYPGTYQNYRSTDGLDSSLINLKT